MGAMAWMIAPAAFLWAPPLWTLALMAAPQRSAERPVVPAAAAPVLQAIAPPRPELATPLQAPSAARPRPVRAPRSRPRPHRAKEPR
jgi:hypothetical protein